MAVWNKIKCQKKGYFHTFNLGKAFSVRGFCLPLPLPPYLPLLPEQRPWTPSGAAEGPGPRTRLFDFLPFPSLKSATATTATAAAAANTRRVQNTIQARREKEHLCLANWIRNERSLSNRAIREAFTTPFKLVVKRSISAVKGKAKSKVMLQLMHSMSKS